MIVLQELDSAGLESALRRGSIDVALLYSSYAGEDYAVRLLQSDHFMVALPQSHRLVRRARVKLLDFANDNFIIPSYATGGTVAEEILEECRHAGFHPQTAHEIVTATVQSTLGLVSAGVGISLIPSALRPFSRKGVVFRSIGETHVPLRLNLQWRQQSASTVLRNFLATVG